MKKIIVAIFTCLILTSLITPAYATVKEDESQKIILIDPGHGGIDGGAKSQSGTIEKDINLQIALKLRDNLEEKGYKVCMTRESDEGLYQEGFEEEGFIKDRNKLRYICFNTSKYVSTKQMLWRTSVVCIK